MTCELCTPKIYLKGSINFFPLCRSKLAYLQSFEKMQWWRSFIAHLICVAMLRISQQMCEMSRCISHFLGGFRWCFELSCERCRIIQFLFRKPAPSWVTDKHTTLFWLQESDVILWFVQWIHFYFLPVWDNVGSFRYIVVAQVERGERTCEETRDVAACLVALWGLLAAQLRCAVDRNKCAGNCCFCWASVQNKMVLLCIL